MKMKIYSAITFFFLSGLAHAENHLIIFGGGGDPQGEKTVFDNGINNLGINLKYSNWKYQASFNGGHSNTEEILNKNFSAPSTPITNFTAENYEKMIEDHKNKIIAGQIKSGDQLMVVIYSHGAQPSPGQLTHKVAVSGKPSSDINNLTGANVVSLDSLQELVQLADSKGIKLAIADLSCHSGATLALKKNAPNTCIISATSSKHYGYAGPNSFPENFLKDLKPGKSLEEAFLNARLSSKYADYPMISTQENDEIENDIFNGITPYLYYQNKNMENKLTPYILENGNSEQLCRRENNFNDLIAKIDSLSLALNSNWTTFNAVKLKGLLEQYKKSQDQILANSLHLSGNLLNNVVDFSESSNSKNVLKKFKISYTWKELLEFDVEKAIANYNIFKKNTTLEIAKLEIDKILTFLNRVNDKKQQILTQNPSLLNYKEQTAILVNSIDNSKYLAEQIAIQEKILYEEIYRKKQADNIINQNTNSNDPCKQIIF